MQKMNLYHGTLDIWVQSIHDIGFKESKNIGYKDYLGKGIYFYNNYKDAEKWAYKKSKDRNTGYAVLKAKVEYKRNKCLNLLDATDSNAFMCFAIELFKALAYQKEAIVFSDDKRKEFSFLADYYCKTHEIDIFIGLINVSNSNTRYLDEFYAQYKIIPFGEVQYCVKNKNIIKNISTERIYPKREEII